MAATIPLEAALKSGPLQAGDTVTILPPYKGSDDWTGKVGRVLVIEPLFAPGEASTRIMTARLEIGGVDDGFYFRPSRLRRAF